MFRILDGLGFGVFQILDCNAAPSYVKLALHPHITSLDNCCNASKQLLNNALIHSRQMLIIQGIQLFVAVWAQTKV